MCVNEPLLMFCFRGDVPEEGQKGSQDIQTVEQRAWVHTESVSVRCTELHQQGAVQHAHAASPGPGVTCPATFLFLFTVAMLNAQSLRSF